MNNYKQLVISAAAVWLLTGLVTESWAQRRPNPHFVPYSSVTFGGGTSTYLGDLAGYSHPLKSLFTLPRWNLGIGYTRQFTPNLQPELRLPGLELRVTTIPSAKVIPLNMLLSMPEICIFGTI
ncbi:hypothetical protein [Spirosoma telluris]